MKKIAMTDLEKKLGHLGPDELILDVRSPEEYRNGHVPGSRNIPFDKVAAHINELQRYKAIYVHCQSGGRAGLASDVLSRSGLKNIVCISGSGMGEWITAGFPVER